MIKIGDKVKFIFDPENYIGGMTCLRTLYGQYHNQIGTVLTITKERYGESYDVAFSNGQILYLFDNEVELVEEK